MSIAGAEAAKAATASKELLAMADDEEDGDDGEQGEKSKKQERGAVLAEIEGMFDVIASMAGDPDSFNREEATPVHWP